MYTTYIEHFLMEKFFDFFQVGTPLGKFLVSLLLPEIMDEMRQKPLYTNLELEILKSEASVEKRRNEEYVKQLIYLC